METTTEHECRCWVHHATTQEHRAQVQRRIEYSRQIGDSTSILLLMAQLAPCPSQPSETTP